MLQFLENASIIFGITMPCAPIAISLFYTNVVLRYFF
jgi:hypothetical protein